jgi:hypothetical protein
MGNRRMTFGIAALVFICSSAVLAQYNCTPSPNPPKLPSVRASGRIATSGTRLRVLQKAGIADSWKATRREIGSVQADTTVEVLEDLIVVDAPDIVRVTEPITELRLKEGDTILRYARLGEGLADFWVDGCWYKEASGNFIIEPDGGGCGGSSCSAKVTKLGRQAWWFRIKLPSGKVGWTLSQSLDLSAGG